MRVTIMSKCVFGMHLHRPLTPFIGLAVLLSVLMATAPPAVASANWFELGLADLKQGHYQAAADKFTLASGSRRLRSPQQPRLRPDLSRRLQGRRRGLQPFHRHQLRLGQSLQQSRFCPTIHW